MPAEESTPAIVLRARDYAEADRIVTLLTRDYGKLSGIAKGAKASKRRFERKLEPFSCVTLFFRRRPLGQLVFISKAEPGELNHPAIEDDLGKIALGSYMLELADALTTEEAEARSAYDVLLDALDRLSNSPASATLRYAYELKMLRAAGYGLDFERCRLCGNAVEENGHPVYFVISRGGVVCGRCRPEAPEGAVRLDGSTAVTLAHISAATFAEVSSIAPSNATGAFALARFLSSILDRKLRSADFLDSVL